MSDLLISFGYAGELLAHCWQAFRLQVAGLPWWYFLAAILLFALVTGFLRFVFFNYLGQSVTAYVGGVRKGKSGGDNPSND